MDNLQAYEKLTGVSLREQKTLWDERGEGYYGEYLVFARLFENVAGACKILMNLQFPAEYGKTTEVDLVLIHETGVYVFEIKHYKGTIYGRRHDEKWTQYFRTVKNSHFLNPIKQNEYHLKNMKNIFPDVPMFSCVVFTNPECSLRITVKQEKDLNIFTLSQVNAFAEWIGKKEKKYDMEAIDAIFCEMSKYAPHIDDVSINEEVLPFYQYINSMASDFQNRALEIKKTSDEINKSHRKQKIKGCLLVSAIATAIILFNWLDTELLLREADKKVESAQLELSEFAQRFEKAEEYGTLYISNDFLSVSDVQFATSKDFANTTKLCFTLNWNGDNYGVSLTKDTKLIVQMKNGTVKEFLLPENFFKIGFSEVRLGKENCAYYFTSVKCDIPYIELYNVNFDDIRYIKLSDMELWEYTASFPKDTSTRIEWEIYDSNTDRIISQDN